MQGNFRLKAQNSMLDYIVKEKSTVDIETCREKGYRYTEILHPLFLKQNFIVRKNVTRKTSKVSLNLILSLGL